jgi:polar amino acid transport system substrate-binding protein
MKRILAVLLAGLMLLSFAACGGKNDKVVKMGLLEAGGMENMYTGEHEAHLRSDSGISNDEEWEFVNYNNLSSALLDLQSGNIALIGLNEATANYVAARDEKIIVGKNGGDDLKTNFSMMTLESNKEVYDILNNAIKDMKADGTLDSLIANELKAYIESEPEAKDLPHFDGAKTIKIGVTGDIPPMDFVASNGKAAGFNIALLTEIANRAQVNFEIIQIESGARAMALSSNKVDAVFWTKSIVCSKCNGAWSETVDGTLVTESYYSATSCAVTLKSDK